MRLNHLIVVLIEDVCFGRTFGPTVVFSLYMNRNKIKSLPFHIYYSMFLLFPKDHHGDRQNVIVREGHQ
jgi:hypothetical protein